RCRRRHMRIGDDQQVPVVVGVAVQRGIDILPACDNKLRRVVFGVLALDAKQATVIVFAVFAAQVGHAPRRIENRVHDRPRAMVSGLCTAAGTVPIVPSAPVLRLFIQTISGGSYAVVTAGGGWRWFAPQSETHANPVSRITAREGGLPCLICLRTSRSARRSASSRFAFTSVSPARKTSRATGRSPSQSCPPGRWSSPKSKPPGGAASGGNGARRPVRRS